MSTDDNPDRTGADDTTALEAQLIRSAGRRETPPAAAYVQVLNAATAAWENKVKRRRRRRMFASMAAGLAVAVLGLLFLIEAPPTALPVAHLQRIIGAAETQVAGTDRWVRLHDESQPVLPGSVLRTAAGSGAGLQLTNGVSLRVADSTELEIQSEHRIRILAGKIYVDTAAAGEQPRRIEVVTPLGSTVDIGTQFEVQYLDGEYRVRVREGRVLVRSGSGEFDSAAGEQLTLRGGGFERTRIGAMDPAWLWVEALAPAPDIESQPLSVLLPWVARETGRPIRFATPEIERKAASTILHGNIRHLAPLQALSVVLATTDLAYILLEDGTILIRSKN